MLRLMEELREHGSWCGETHVQKAAFLLQDLLGKDLGFQHILYKYGPYSFGLTDALTVMQADYLVQVQPKQGYGPTLLVSESGRALMKRWPKTLAEHEDAISFVAKVIGDRGVADLERLATAWFVTRDAPGSSVDARAERLIALKPHVSRADALDAVREMDQIADKVRHGSPR
jgi:uncharacterized protein YwgA